MRKPRHDEWISCYNTDRAILLDRNDFARVSNYRWHYRGPDTDSNFRGRQIYGTVDGQVVSLPRFILGAAPGQTIRMKDGDVFNCQRENLLVFNSRAEAASYSPRKQKREFRGVTQVRDRWRVDIMVKGVQCYLGLYDSEDFAASVYEAAYYLARNIQPPNYLSELIVQTAAEKLQLAQAKNKLPKRQKPPKTRQQLQAEILGISGGKSEPETVSYATKLKGILTLPPEMQEINPVEYVPPPPAIKGPERPRKTYEEIQALGVFDDLPRQIQEELLADYNRRMAEKDAVPPDSPEK